MTTPPAFPPYQPGQPNQPPAQPGPGGPGVPQPGQDGTAIRMNVQGSVMTSNMVPPTISFDGFHVPIGYGTHVVPVTPGPHHIEAHSQWLRRYGQASLDVTVAPGQVVDVFYASPLHQFTTGSMGLEKQTRKGWGCMIALLGVIVLVVVLAIVAATLS